MGSVAAPLYRELGLTEVEYENITGILGREPNHAELAMYSVMWSEHCSYKSSRVHLARLPSDGDHVLMGPGEGAGVIRVGNAAIAIRIESHNHPSFIEPFQGAATGVGGIIRDVLSVGARPVALFDSLRFGPLPSKAGGRVSEKNRSLFEGVVDGISSYGNCLGVPTVGGEVKFEESYSGNPLVNVMCIGVAPLDRILRSKAEREGDVVILMGASTGRDGIGGVSVLASATFDSNGDGGNTAEASSKRPSVQVGDPLTEKVLIEASLEMMDARILEGVQDLGGAGLACATSETAANGGSGMAVDLAAVPRRETGMEPFEVLTSESQERMLIVVRPENVDQALGICEKWGLDAASVGKVTSTGRLRVHENGSEVADIPAASLGEGLAYTRPARRPDYLDELSGLDTDLPPEDLAAALMKVVSSPSVASKRWVWEQYDHQVMLGTVVGPGHDAAVLRVEGAQERVAATTDGNSRYCQIDPYLGTVHSVAEAYRNLSVVGARPLAITNCLNFGSPENPEVMWQFTESVRGLGDSAKRLEVPVISGNVSFYNETAGTPIYPTPVIGMVGSIEEGMKSPPLAFSREGDEILALGTTRAELGGSEYAKTILGVTGGVLPAIDLGAEESLGRLLRRLIEKRWLSSAHDVSEGGLAVALAECCIHSAMGAEILPPTDLAPYQWLFSESASRAVVSASADEVSAVLDLAEAEDVAATRIGRVQGDSFELRDAASIPVEDLIKAFELSIPAAMGYNVK